MIKMNDQPERHLNWQACYNIREVGGYPTEDGGQIRWRSLIRADNLSRLTAEGQAALIDYGVGTIIDLRSPDEFGLEPYPFGQATSRKDGPTTLNLPLENRADVVAMPIIDRAEPLSEKYGLMLDHFKAQVATIFQAFAGAREGAMLFHCQAGKDRTGLVIALLLALAGVPEAVIASDYAESETCLRPLYEKLVAEAGDDPAKLAALPPEPRASPETMLAVLAHLETGYGGVPAYLRAAGLAEPVLEQIRGRLRG